MNDRSGFLKRITAAIVAGVLFFALGFSVLGCTPQKSSEDIIREGIAKEFDNIEETIGSAMASGEAGLAQFGVDETVFVKTWLSGFQYNVDSVQVKGNTATATVTMTGKSLSQAMRQWETQVNTLVADPGTYLLSEAELNARIGSLLMDSINNAPVVITTVQLPYVLEGNTWKPGSDFETQLSQALTGGSL